MSKRFLLSVLMILVLVLAACGGDDKDKKDKENETAPSAPDAQSNADAQPAAKGPVVLAWHSSTNGGRLLALQENALPLERFTAPAGSTRVQPCSHRYRLPGGVLLYAGGESGDLVYYPLDGSESVTIGQTARLTCAGPDTLQIFPDSNQLAYLRMERSAVRGNFLSGMLIVYDLAQRTEQPPLDSTEAFGISGDTMLVLRFYPDGKGNATEVDLDRWTESGPQTITTLTPVPPENKPDTECAFISGAVALQKDNAYVLLGQSCEQVGSRWRLIRVALDGGSQTEIASGEPGGSFYPDNFSLQLFMSLDGAGALVAAPSGLERHIVRLDWVNLGDGTITPVAEFAVADRLGLVEVEGRHLLRSPDGRWLAFEPVNRSQDSGLRLLDLATPGGSGQILVEPAPKEGILDYRWTADGRLYYIAGSAESNSLWLVTPGAEPARVTRGRFIALVPDTAGERLAVAEWIPDPNNADKSLAQLALLDAAGNRVPLWQATATDEMIVPLALP